MEHICPVCRKSLSTPAKAGVQVADFYPFCSRRCKLIDLGAWLDGDYRIAPGSAPADPGDPSCESEAAAQDQ